MVAPLEAGRIHSLPVLVTYHLQSSSQTFSTLFASPQQVYVHPNAGSSRSDADEETWGAIYLKAVVQGVVLASPELHPAHPGTPDLSLYVLDPRETYLRRSRATPHPRSRPSAGHEVWAGKGLVSWALAEANQGKNLITGRVVRRPEFLNIPPTTTDDGMSALEALVAAHSSRSTTESEAWGIEISVGLKSSLSASSAFPRPLHQAVENGSVTGILEPEEDDVPDSPAPIPAPRPSTVARIPSFPAARTASSSSNLPPRPIPRNVMSSPAGPSRGRAPIVRRKKTPGSEADERSKLTTIDMNKSPASPSDLAQVKSALGKMAAEGHPELTPEVLKLLEKFAGSTSAQQAATEKRLREEEASKNDAKAKRARSNAAAPRSEMSNRTYGSSAPCKCSNCGTTKSSVWRQQQEPDGTTVRVCNACGLYYNKKMEPRPPSMWQSDENGIVRGRGRTKASDRAGFKRTLTQAAEQDADRIANSRRVTRGKGGKAPASRAKAAPQTSPARRSAPLPRSVRVAAATSVAASSPGPWQAPESTTPIGDPGSSAGEHSKPMQSLAMPLSDDGSGHNESQAMQWTDDLSAFFNVDGFAMAPGNEASPSRSPVRNISSADARNASSALRNHVMAQPTSDAVEASDDDVFSELFNRTSSFGQYQSSPTPFDFSQLPPSSPPAIPGSLPHSLLFSSPSGSPVDPSPRSVESKTSPHRSGLRNEVTLHDDKADGDENIHELLHKLASGTSELLDLFNAFPAPA